MKTLTLQRPQAKQIEFLKAQNRFIAYGGARGGGKSWAVRMKAVLLALNYSGIRIMILRRTFPELQENHIKPLRAMLGDIAKYRVTDKAFEFVNGSFLRFGYCDGEADVLQYQGLEYDVIFIDEATQFTEFQFQTLTACVRGANKFPKRIYLTCNPGGVGHTWVKRLFVDRDYKATEREEDYAFIKATVYDNEILLENDPEYVRTLENLPSEQRRAWLEGDWDIFVGQYFTEFRRETHVIEQFEIPSEWRRYFTMDYGLDMLAGYWIALDGSGRAYVYREIYKSGLIISEAAENIKEFTQDEDIYAYYAPPDLWNRRQDTGKSVAEIFYDKGIVLTQASNERVAGWLALKEWLKPHRDEYENITADLQICNNCVNLIRTLPALQFDTKRQSDVANEPHELTHAPDALRYFVAGRPAPSEAVQAHKTANFAFERKKENSDGRDEEIKII